MSSFGWDVEGNTPTDDYLQATLRPEVPSKFEIDKWAQLDRFLVLGTEGGTYYASEREFTLQNLRVARACIAESGIAAKLIVVGMTSTGFSVADPRDGGMLDVVGFDAAAPQVISDFIRG